MIIVAKPEWGAKHTCAGCGAKFYDMGRTPITCPACDEVVVVAAPSRSRRARKEEPAPAPVVVEAAPEVDKKSSDDEDDAIANLADDDDEGENVLAEADIDTSKLSDET